MAALESCWLATALVGLLTLGLRVRTFLLNPVPFRLRFCRDLLQKGPSLLLPAGGYYYCSLDPRGRPEIRHQPETGRRAEGLGTVHVVYAADAPLFPLLLGSMTSLARRVAAPGLCSIHVIVPGEDLALAEGVVGCWRRAVAALGAQPRVALHRLRVPASLARLGYREIPAELKRTSLAHARIYLATDYLPDVRRVLWLDVDTIVKADITPLYRMHMEHVIAAAPDSKMGVVHNKHNIPWLGRHHEGEYFCSGVLLMELRLWRLANLTAAIEKVIHDGQLILTHGHHEQPALNIVFSKKFDVLDWRWHLQTLNSHVPVPRELTDQARILHWNGLPEKPMVANNKTGARKKQPNDHLYESPGIRCEVLG